jgi:dihydroorotate dehydrogenase
VNQFLISPPFGNWVNVSGCTRVMGSYTLHKRPGLIRNTIKSLRRVPGGWVNRIGLRNPGIAAIKYDPTRVYSVVGLEDGDWERIVFLIPITRLGSARIEVNLGCPNVHEYGITGDLLSLYTARFAVQAKLPPTDKADATAEMCVQAGVKLLHCSNTIPTERGGESGKRLKALNLPIVERLAKRYPTIPIIAGGGIYSAQDVVDYRNAGATFFSLSTVFFTPWRVPAILKA